MPVPAKEGHTADAVDAPNGHRLARFVPLGIVLIATIAVFAAGLHRQLTLEGLIHHRMIIDTLVYLHPFLALAIYVGLYIGVVALSIPAAVILTVSGGLLFGTFIGAAAAVCGATIGATIIFLIARSAFGEWLFRGAGPRIARIAASVREDAFNYLLFLRLIPLFPFWLVNLVAAFAGVGLVPFVVATALGIIPLALLGAFLGAGLDSLIAEQIGAFNVCKTTGQPDCSIDVNLSAVATPKIVAALCALCLVALAPVVVRRIRAARRSSTNS